MWKGHRVLLLLSFITTATCDPYLVITRTDDEHNDVMAHNIVETVGSNLSLTCTLKGLDEAYSNLAWGRRSKELWFENTADLRELVQKDSKQILGFQLNKSLEINRATKVFEPLKVTDRGTYFCMSLKYMLFKIVRIKVNEELICNKYQFKCENGKQCINPHETCDNIFHCIDHSDEKWELCRRDCEEGIRCGDRCIPTKWCCDIKTDSDCFITVRNSCCPPLPVHTDIFVVSDDNNNDFHGNNKFKDSKPAHNIILFIASAIVILTVFIVIFFGIKECSRNSNNQNQTAMPSIIRTDDNDNTMILTSLPNSAYNMNSSREYLDLPPTYDDSTRNSPQSSFHNSLEDINIEPVIQDCSLPPSYDEALANIPSSIPSLSNTPEPPPAFLDVPSVSSQRATSRDI